MPVASSIIMYFIAVTCAGAGVARITEQWRWRQVNGLEMLRSRNQMAPRRVVFGWWPKLPVTLAFQVQNVIFVSVIWLHSVYISPIHKNTLRRDQTINLQTVIIYGEFFMSSSHSTFLDMGDQFLFIRLLGKHEIRAEGLVGWLRSFPQAWYTQLHRWSRL